MTQISLLTFNVLVFTSDIWESIVPQREILLELSNMIILLEYRHSEASY